MIRVGIIGATGILGRPIVRVLRKDSEIDLVAFTRNIDHARRVLPSDTEIQHADLTDAKALIKKLEGFDALHLNLAHPFSQKARFDPDRDGSIVALTAAREAGIKHILRISALEVSALPDSTWWVLQRKRETDQRFLESPLRCTIFRPSWFMESLPMFAVAKRFLLTPRVPRTGLRWIAGEDYARQVAAAIKRPDDASRFFEILGPEPVPFADAVHRFIAASHRRLIRIPMPRAVLHLAASANPQPRYLRDLLEATFACDHARNADDTWDQLGRPQMTIEDYAKSIETTGDFPQK